MKMKQNQIFFALDIFKSDTISFLSRDIKVFQWLSKSEFYSFMTKVNPNNGNETNQAFSHETYSNLTSYIFYEKMLKYFTDFQNQNFSVLWLQWSQTTEMKQNQTFFHDTHSDLTSFFSGRKTLNYFNDFYNWHFSISLQKWV